MFVLGCKSLTIATDHKPLLGIFGNKDITKIMNPRILKLKEKTLKYDFEIKYNPGTWNRAVDALSHNPIPSHSQQTTFLNPLRAILNKSDIVEHDNREDAIETVQIFAIDFLNHCASISDETCSKSITMGNLRTACKKESTYNKLVANIENGFPQSRMKTDPDLRDYWEVRHRLSSVDGIAMLDSRIIIPYSYRSITLKMLYSAHQGVGSMTRRANQTVYWPGITRSIRNTRYNCDRSNSSSPSQAKEPLITSKSPEYPFKCVCADYFKIKGHHYLVIVDRFSS